VGSLEGQWDPSAPLKTGCSGQAAHCDIGVIRAPFGFARAIINLCQGERSRPPPSKGQILLVFSRAKHPLLQTKIIAYKYSVYLLETLK